MDGMEAAITFLDGPASALAPLLAGVAFGIERHLARPVVILPKPSTGIEF